MYRTPISSKSFLHFRKNIRSVHISVGNGAKSEIQERLRINNRGKLDISQNEILYGRSVCNIALKVSRRPVFRLHVLHRWRDITPDDNRVTEILEVAGERKISLCYASRKQLDAMVSYRPHQGVCLEVGELPYLNMDETSCKDLLHSSNPAGSHIWLLLHGILDPMNVGAILRSCLFFNVKQVLMAGNCSPLTPVVSKASSGASEILQVHSTEEPLKIVQILKSENWDVMGTVANVNAVKEVEDIAHVKLVKPTLVAFGSEGDGLSEDILNCCTRFVTIGRQSQAHPAGHFVGSLNVSTACAIILHTLKTAATS